jgi:hypothetical protein
MPERPSPPRLGLTVGEAAEAIGMSESSFKRHVQPELHVVRRGSLRVIPISEIERWLASNATLAAAGRLDTAERGRSHRAAAALAKTGHHAS